ncbi:MAG: DUF3604 domain-containing protein, partial [Betaproteobacteria bacterium]
EADVDLAAGAQLGFARRWPSDWGTPQSRDPAAADYVRVAAAPERPVRWWTARLHGWHPFDHVLFVALPDGLPAGERLDVHFGEASEGSPGFTVQTFIEEASPLAVRLLATPESHWVELARPTVRIAGAAAHRLVLTAPSRVAAGQPFELHLRIEDAWGNPSTLDTPIRFDAPLSREVTLPDSGWMRIEATLSPPGIHRLTAGATGEPAFHATSNPVEVVPGALDAQLCWGDLHAQSVIGCGARSIDAYYHHARDFAATDFASHQANCFLVSNPEWDETRESTARMHDDGRFVTLLGVEWSGASSAGGDHNLYFPGDTAALHRCSHEFVADKSDIATDLPHVTDVHAHYSGTDTLVAVHVGGRTADLRWHAPALDRLLEVHSTHATSEWFLFDALRRGYRMGVVAGSDSVDGRPGNSHPGHMEVRNVRGGLTAAVLPERTRGALWSALKSRHCYATTGERILLKLNAGAAQMGDEIRVVRLPAFEAMIEGTAPLETIDFFRDDECIASTDLMAAATTLSNTVRVGWCGAGGQGNWQRARMIWDGELRVDGARIVAAQPWAFDTPDEGLREIESGRVRWRSITAGDWDGLTLELDDPAAAAITFVSGPMTFRAHLGALHALPLTFAAESPMRKVELRRLPERPPALGWRGRFEDPDPPAGDHAYWVRVRQSDGAYAWSTSIFTTLDAKPIR